MIHRSLRCPAIPLAALFLFALVLAFALAGVPAHAQELPDPGELLPIPEEPAPEEPAPEDDDGFEQAPQVTETPLGAVAAGAGGTAGGTDGGASATPLLVLGAMTLAGAGALAVRRRVTTADAR